MIVELNLLTPSRIKSSLYIRLDVLEQCVVMKRFNDVYIVISGIEYKLDEPIENIFALQEWSLSYDIYSSKDAIDKMNSIKKELEDRIDKNKTEAGKIYFDSRSKHGDANIADLKKLKKGFFKRIFSPR